MNQQDAVSKFGRTGALGRKLAAAGVALGMLLVGGIGLVVDREALGDRLIQATLAGELAAVRSLLDAGADPDFVFQTNTALIYAARDGHTGIVALLLERGGDVNWIDGEGVTPLILAAFKGHVAIARMLLEAGADPTVRDLWQRSALDYALRRGSEDEIARLLQAALAEGEDSE